MTLSVHDIENSIAHLPLNEQLLLLERIAHQIRLNSQLNTMAYDPQIQNELQQIQQEFAIAELDGLVES
jgi:hypothetical protein